MWHQLATAAIGLTTCPNIVTSKRDPEPIVLKPSGLKYGSEADLLCHPELLAMLFQSPTTSTACMRIAPKGRRSHAALYNERYQTLRQKSQAKELQNLKLPINMQWDNPCAW